MREAIEIQNTGISIVKPGLTYQYVESLVEFCKPKQNRNKAEVKNDVCFAGLTAKRNLKDLGGG